ncbi:MAG: hypothetical protein LIO37_05295 [Clostridiales bacterium]|nr:hypothetical protein [Clostridiales bacterium]
MKIGIILLIIVLVLVAICVALYFVGKRAEKKKQQQDEQLAAAAQNVTLLVIDKKRMPVKEAGLPQAVIDQTPKMMRRSKLPIVKVKLGPRIMSMIADEKIYDDIPVKKEIKATISGLYITDIRGLRGPLPKAESRQKKSLRSRLMKKYEEASREVRENEAQKAEAKEKAEQAREKAKAKKAKQKK